MSTPIDWEAVPQAEYEAYTKRMEIVELILEGSIDAETKTEAKKNFCEEQGVCERSLANYIRRYREKGPRGLLFYHPRPHSPRIRDEQLRAVILQLIHELPTRSVPTLRRLLNEEENLGPLISAVSDRTIYRFLFEQGLGHKERSRILSQTGRRAYRAFEAPHSLALVQADARDGIWLVMPDGKTRKSYLFLWIDDYSRKILFGRYYLDEKLPCMEDSFRHMILRWGIPFVCYMDNGAVYISRHFAGVLAELGIKQLRHKPYQAHAKGKVESLQKTIKNEFQAEAACADFHTLEELNSAFEAWAELLYNRRIHSSTGQTPDERFQQGLPKDHRRVTDLAAFSAAFLWKESRTVSKWGKIKLFGNEYPIQKASHGTVVQVRFDPFALQELYIYSHANIYLETTRPSKTVTVTAPHIPEESQASPATVSRQSVAFFSRLRQRHLAELKQQNPMSFAKLLRPPEDSHV